MSSALPKVYIVMIIFGEWLAIPFIWGQIIGGMWQPFRLLFARGKYLGAMPQAETS